MVKDKEVNYHTVKGVLERANFLSSKFTDRELDGFFHATPETIKRLREDEKKVVNNEKEEISDSEARKKLREAFKEIISILKKYCDLKEEHYHIIALWIIGTYIHDEFASYPFLFINAMRGSGKSRLLKLISILSNNGMVLTHISEAVLFRTAKGSTICIDEFESIESKEKKTLRELLNAAYKKGTKVQRLKKVNTKEGEKYEVETFDLYSSITMANILGMDEVLEDRCISLIIEKSDNQNITRLIEDFEENPQIKNVTTLLSFVSVVMCRVVRVKNIGEEWNKYLINPNNYTQHTLHNTHNTDALDIHKTALLKLLKKMDDIKIGGRDIELFYPLFIISNTLGEKELDKTLEIATELIKNKKDEQMVESKDVMFIDFISKRAYTLDYIPVLELTRSFKDFVGDVEDDDKWVNTHWVGVALKRLNLVISKRRVSKGREVILNISKAEEKIKMFK